MAPAAVARANDAIKCDDSRATSSLMRAYSTLVIWILILWLVLGVWRLRKRRIGPGPAAAAAMNELLTNDRRAAVEIIVEERTGQKDPEDRDGNLPELGRPGAG
jgi:hypothetical protein